MTECKGVRRLFSQKVCKGEKGKWEGQILEREKLERGRECAFYSWGCLFGLTHTHTHPP